MTTAFVYAIFKDEKRAVTAVRGMLDAGFPARDVSALLRGPDTEELAPAHHTGIPRGALLGATLGALGGGALVASGGILFAGPAFLALQGGALAGGALGTLLGTLAGLAHWNDAIEFPERAFKRGGVLVGVTTHTARAGLALEILLRAGGRRARVSTKREAKKIAKDGPDDGASTPQSQAAS